jgi:surface antigen
MEAGIDPAVDPDRSPSIPIGSDRSESTCGAFAGGRMTRAFYRPLAGLTLGLLLVAAPACGGPNEAAGGFGGAVAGGLLGGMLGGPRGLITGALIGGLLGDVIGHRMDERDRRLAERDAELSLEYGRTGTTRRWHNPDNDHHGSFTPLRTYRRGDEHCREYRQTVTIGGQRQEAYGTACRQPDGRWRVQK